MLSGNVLQDVPKDFPEEIFQTLIQTDAVKIERIISHGQTSPDAFWYDQEEHEWVLLLEGKARIQFEDEHIVELHAGDYINIPAHVKHRVVWTTHEQPTVWLAVFYS